jgi:PAS domain S-box-containing protein
VRNCPVKAIRIVDDQAQIIEEKCIACGKCFLVCPQNARNIHTDLDIVKKALKKKKVVVSIAPSYAGIYDDSEKVIGALHELGIYAVEETGVGAELVTDLYNKYIMNHGNQNHITSCCPSVNMLIRKFYPELRNNLIPVDSPMVLHSKILKEIYGQNSFVVFLGPCISKKCEAFGYQKDGIIDAVISFEELEVWLKEVNIDLSKCERKKPDTKAGRIGAKYPLDGGILSGLKHTVKEKNIKTISVAGIEDCMVLFESMKKKEITNICVEANVCHGGCIGGPAIPKGSENIFKRRIRAGEKIEKNEIEKYNSDIFLDIDRFKPYDRKMTEKKYEYPVYIEERLKEIMHGMGKYSKEDELNCGACGYDSCIEKAKAVYEGISHPEMCIPHMRIKAERFSNVIFEVSPNILMLLDEKLNIVDLNPQAEKIFNVKLYKIKGQNINKIMSSEDFEKVIYSKENILGKKINLTNFGMKLKEYIIYIKEQKLLFGLFSNVTDEEKRSEELAELKFSTLKTVNSVIDRQMRVAQEIAGLLGETTADAKIALLNLKKVVEGEEGEVK